MPQNTNPILANLTLAPDAAVDLHMHTTYSDGRWPAEQLIEYLANEGFDLVAVTDHDRVDKVAEIQQLAAQKGLPVLPGVEMSTNWKGHLAHVLCFGFDPANNYLVEVTERTTRLQLENTYQIYDRLLHNGYQFPRQEEVLASNQGKLRRPADNITLLLEHGYVENRNVGLKLITDHGFVSILADMAEVVDATHRSNGVSLIAHPGRREQSFTFYDLDMLNRLRADMPLDGIEVYHPYHTPEVVEMYLGYVKEHGLLQSTGSDSHSHPGRMPRKHRAELSRQLLERLGVRVS